MARHARTRKRLVILPKRAFSNTRDISRRENRILQDIGTMYVDILHIRYYTFKYKYTDQLASFFRKTINPLDLHTTATASAQNQRLDENRIFYVRFLLLFFQTENLFLPTRTREIPHSYDLRASRRSFNNSQRTPYYYNCTL